MPLRRYLFLGLTLVLIVALTNLIIRGYRREKEQARQMVETVEEAKPSSTRVFNPQDLRVLKSIMEPQPGIPKGEPLRNAMPQVEVLNGGSVTYREILLKFVFLSPAGHKLETKTYLINKPIAPGETIRITDIGIKDIPAEASDLETTIVYADIESPKSSSK